jgi:hypothetical protein
MVENKWGPVIWCFLHGIAEMIHPVHYVIVKDTLWNFIKEICNTLPCPDCSAHATAYLSRIRTPSTKDQLIQTLYQFHNDVNQNTGKPSFPIEGLVQYKQMPMRALFTLYKNAILNQPYNPFLMMHKMRSKRCIDNLQLWLQQQQLLQL